MILSKVVITILFMALSFTQCVEQTNQKLDDRMKMTNKTPNPKLEFIKLMSILDISEFNEFISKEENKKIILRIPLTAVYEGSKVFGPDHYFIGDLEEGQENIKLKLNDTRMGIGVKSHLMNGCEEDLCTFWLDVVWQGMDGKQSMMSDEGTYEVMAMGFLDDTEDLDRGFVYVRK